MKRVVNTKNRLESKRDIPITRLEARAIPNYRAPYHTDLSKTSPARNSPEKTPKTDYSNTEKSVGASIRNARPEAPKPRVSETTNQPEVHTPSFKGNKDTKGTKKNNLRLLLVGASSLCVFGILVVIGITMNQQPAVQKDDEHKAVANQNSFADVSEDPITDDQYKNHSVPADQARYLRIGSVGVKAIVSPVDTTKVGAVDVPKSIFAAGWYDQSSKPMDLAGAMLVVGHYSGSTRARGIFGKLEKAKKGDVIEVETGDARVRKFSIVSATQYPYDKIDMAKALTPTDTNKLGLSLITCSGEFKKSIDTYDQRLLVRAIAVN
jgi:sortase (surface protein transpeptidase)